MRDEKNNAYYLEMREFWTEVVKCVKKRCRGVKTDIVNRMYQRDPELRWRWSLRVEYGLDEYFEVAFLPELDRLLVLFYDISCDGELSNEYRLSDSKTDVVKIIVETVRRTSSPGRRS